MNTSLVSRVSVACLGRSHRSVPELLKAPIPDAPAGKKPIRLQVLRSGLTQLSQALARRSRAKPQKIRPKTWEYLGATVAQLNNLTVRNA